MYSSLDNLKLFKIKLTITNEYKWTNKKKSKKGEN